MPTGPSATAKTSQNAAAVVRPRERAAPTSIAKAAASSAVTSTAHATSYPAIHARACAASMGRRASCGYTHASSTPTMDSPASAWSDHGS